ncbi:flavohemoglobin expression-modulating QEGLA motif protein [Roseivirga sp. BDSF3-8]|uniref:flavohemoglobin expression-modulating QEGLA motif protein n=1 Tax=Roseivirga sp. BDSF3-8 TaxID=3241598 RepID=UPI003531E7B6
MGEKIGDVRPAKFTWAEIQEKIHTDKSVHTALPDGGFLSFDHRFPFLCLYRFAKGDRDESMVRLIRGQANYLLVPQEDMELPDVYRNLIGSISEVRKEAFDAFLLVEVWSQKTVDDAEPSFHLFAPRSMAQSTRQILEDGLKELSMSVPGSVVVTERGDIRHPAGKGPAFSIDEYKENSVLALGIQMPLFFGTVDTIRYPIPFRSFKSHFTRLVKKAIFEFIRVQTTISFAHFGVLGTSLLEERVREVDAQLAEINNTYDFLLAVTPVNTAEEWERFKQNNCSEPPVFRYRLLPADPEKMKRDLYDISIDRIDDPTLAFLLHDKRAEMDKEISMLEERNTQQFLYNSFRLYGKPDAELVNLAKAILDELRTGDEEEEPDRVSPEAFRRQGERYIQALRNQDGAFGCDIRIRKDLDGIMVSRGCLMISDTFYSPAHRVAPLLEHEIGTHSVTYYNGKKQPLELFYVGLAGYDEWQEGLAVFSEYMAGGLTRARLRLLAARVIAANHLAEGADFIENYGMLQAEHGFGERTAFNITTRIHRGGGLTKDAIYLRGFQKLLHYMQHHDEMEHLYVGKLAEKHIPYIEELLYRSILKKPEVLPLFLHQNKLKEKLAEIRSYQSITELATH